MTRFVSGEAEMEENPILKASLSMASDIPLYAQLTGIIKNTITSGTLRVGDLLPSEAELCDKFEISRNTVRQAIGSLEEAGFVVRKRGKGTFVADPSTRRKGVQYSFTTEISSMGKHPSSTLVSFDIIDPAPKIKRLMALEDGVKVYCFTRVRNVDNEPLILETSYYPQHIYPNLTREMLETHSFYSLLYHVGVVPFAAEDSYEAVTLGEYEAKLLGCVPGAAAFHHQRRGFAHGPLGLAQHLAHHGHRGDAGGQHAHLFGAHFTADGHTVAAHCRGPPLAGQAEGPLAALFAQFLFGEGLRTGPQLEGQATEHGAGIQISDAEPRGHGLCDGALSGARRTVDGNVQSLHTLLLPANAPVDHAI